MPNVALSTAAWSEPPTDASAPAFARLRPVKTAAGYWIFVAAGSEPAGSTIGAVVQGASYDTFLTSTTTGLRATRISAGAIFFY